ncbi:hypothetical protein D3C78_1807580 [compost metagenome]
MQVGDVCGHWALFDYLANLIDDRGIHLRIQQDASRFAEQPLGPDGDHYGANNTHQRIEPRSSPPLTAQQGNDRQR